MAKKRRTVSLDPEVDSYLDTEGVNASQLVNRLVKTHNTAGGDDVAMLRLRERQLESDVEELESRLQTKADELELVREQLSEHEDTREELVAEAAGAIDPHIRVPDNPAVENWSDIIGVTPDELVRLLEEHDD